MVSNYPGIIECIKDDFYYFLDINYLELKKSNNDILIYHKKYKFIFNHESPKHANLHILENWEYGENHFILNNFKYFIKRYTNRINNFKYYINSGNHIIFLLNRHRINNTDDIKELDIIIKNKYPHLNYNFLFTPHSTSDECLIDNLKNMGFSNNDNEIQRLII